MGWTRADDINAWWERLPGERYWLDVTQRDERDELLAAPRGQGRTANSWTHRLITHVRDGDVVFRYEPSQRSITGWHHANGRVEKRDLSWPLASEHAGNGSAVRRLPSWRIGLREPTWLRTGVSLTEVARVQWDLFPALRDLEDRSGGPIYYPFEMGVRDTTQPLSGYVFKLPAVFVQSFTEFTGALVPVARSSHTRGRSTLPSTVPASSHLATSR